MEATGKDISPLCACQSRADCPYAATDRAFELCRGTAGVPAGKRQQYRDLVIRTATAPPQEPVDPARAIEDAAEARYAATHVCSHRGETVGQVGCRSCQGIVNLQAYRCNLHEVRCTAERRSVEAVVRWCEDCGDNTTRINVRSGE